MSSVSLFLRAILLSIFLSCPQSFLITVIKQRNSFQLNDVASEYEISTEKKVVPIIIDKPDSVKLPQQSVWTVFGELAAKTGGSNLGQGFPDWDPPDFLLDSLRAVVDTKFHQYTRPAGHPPLVQLIAKKYSKHLDRVVDPMNEVAVTVGASQALYLALTLFLKPHDEVILFEPFFDLYGKQIKLTGAIPKYVSLGGRCATEKDPWALDIDSLRRAITSKTKMLILNTPHNPTGKVFTLAEMEAIAVIVRENPDLIVISDEVYKFSVYNPLEEGDSSSIGHYHFSRLNDMWDRTITLSSCGKTFSCTGWQVGWTVGPSKYIKPMQAYPIAGLTVLFSTSVVVVLSNGEMSITKIRGTATTDIILYIELLPCVQFCASTPIQHALTNALEVAELPYKGQPSYYEWLRQQFLKKREILEEGLLAVGIEPVVSHGGFFLMAKLPYYKDLEIYDDLQMLSADGDKDLGEELQYEPYDWKFCRKMAHDYGIIAIPASPFFSENSSVADSFGPLARFAFCKKDETLLLAANRLKEYAKKNNIVGLKKK